MWKCITNETIYIMLIKLYLQIINKYTVVSVSAIEEVNEWVSGRMSEWMGKWVND